MSVRNVREAVTRVTTDQVLDKQDAQEIIDSAGKSVSDGELEAIIDAFQTGGYRVDSDAINHAVGVLQDVVQANRYAEYLGAKVEAAAPVFATEEAARLEPGTVTFSLGGTEIPEAVKDIVNNALAGGAIAYDVRSVDKAEKDEEHGGYHVPGVFSPYPQETDAVSNLSFDYTELTPAKIKADMETEQTFKVLTGYKDQSFTDPRTGAVTNNRIAQYEERTMKGSGDIRAHYDEASHNEPFARNPNGDKFASNFSIMSDGTLHAIPLVRRNPASAGLILTNPSLARGQRMLFNGHIGMTGGVVTSIGLSGRLHKLAQRGDAKFIDPVPLLKAWGFEVSPNLTVSMEGRHGAVDIDPNTHVIGN